jgi:DNA replication and repair protein RecF
LSGKGWARKTVMKINKLKLTNFRNHKDLDISFDENSTIIVGPNGIGKTNILEAIHLLATTKSLRATYDREMIAHNEKHSRVDAEFNPNGDTKTLEMTLVKSDKFENKATKKVKIDKVNKSLNAFAGTINSVLFTPHDIEMVTASPSVRRKYLDLLFFQIDKEYKRAHSQYTRALRQRNKVLEKMRDLGVGRDELEYWTEKVLSTGSLLQAKRRMFFNFVQENIQRHADDLNEDYISYQIEYDINEMSEARLEKYKDTELAAARTLIGPHRDDFFINYNNFDVAKFGSRGQKRTTLLALKLCEIDFINENLGRRPILLLDDIFSELDEQHKEAVLNIVDLQQTIITSADDLDINEKLLQIRL